MIPTDWTVIGWRLDVVINLVVLVTLLALVALFYWRHQVAFERHGRDDERGFGYGIATILADIFALIALAVLVVGAFPFQARYLKLYRVEATVVSVSNVIDEASGDLTRTPVVELKGVDRPVVIDDPRIVRLAGADLGLTCTIGWHYQAADTYSCEIREVP